MAQKPTDFRALLNQWAGAGVAMLGAFQNADDMEIAEAELPQAPPATRSRTKPAVLPKGSMHLAGGALTDWRFWPRHIDKIKKDGSGYDRNFIASMKLEDYDITGYFTELDRQGHIRGKKVVVITSPLDPDPKLDPPNKSARESGWMMSAIMQNLKAEDVYVIDSHDRAFFESEEVTRKLREADFVFIGGGSQEIPQTLLEGTPGWEAFEAHFRQGKAHYGGTSAGASVASRRMVNGGDAKTAPGMMHKGLGLTACCIDTHVKRGRDARMLTCIQTFPDDHLMIGLDEGAWVEIEAGQIIRAGGKKGHVFLLHKKGDQCVRYRLPCGEGFVPNPTEPLAVYNQGQPNEWKYWGPILADWHEAWPLLEDKGKMCREVRLGDFCPHLVPSQVELASPDGVEAPTVPVGLPMKTEPMPSNMGRKEVMAP